MKRSLLTLLFCAAAFGADPQPGADKGTQRIIREVRHELVTLPYYVVFDELNYRVDGTTVTLTVRRGDDTRKVPIRLEASR